MVWFRFNQPAGLAAPHGLQYMQGSEFHIQPAVQKQIHIDQK